MQPISPMDAFLAVTTVSVACLIEIGIFIVMGMI
jgi:hypothetical protein